MPYSNVLEPCSTKLVSGTYGPMAIRELPRPPPGKKTPRSRSGSRSTAAARPTQPSSVGLYEKQSGKASSAAACASADGYDEVDGEKQAMTTADESKRSSFDWPQKGYPQQGYPEQDYPQQSYPPQGYPQQRSGQQQLPPYFVESGQPYPPQYPPQV